MVKDNSTQAEIYMFVNQGVEKGGKLFWRLKKGRHGKIYLTKVLKKGKRLVYEKSIGPVDLIEKIVEEWKQNNNKKRVRSGAGGRARTSDHRVNRQVELWDSKRDEDFSSTPTIADVSKIWWKKPDNGFLDWLKLRVSQKTFQDYKRYWQHVPDFFGIDDIRRQCVSSRWYKYIYSKIADYLWMTGAIGLEDRERIKTATRVNTQRKKTGAEKISLEKYIWTLRQLAEKRPAISLYYEIMYYSGARLEEAAHLIKNAEKKQAVDLGNSVRITMNYNRGRKRCDYLYLPKQLWQKILGYKGEKPNARTISSYIKNLNKRKKLELMNPKDVRKLHMQLMKQNKIDYEIRNFIQNRVSKLSVGERHYEALLNDADKTYPTIANKLTNLLKEVEGLG